MNGKTYVLQLNTLDELGLTTVDNLPYSIRVLLESVLRQYDGHVIKEEHIMNLAKRGKSNDADAEDYSNHRVILQDFTGVPSCRFSFLTKQWMM